MIPSFFSSFLKLPSLRLFCFCFCIAFFPSLLLAEEEFLMLKEEQKILKGEVLQLTPEGVHFRMNSADFFVKTEEIEPMSLFELHKKRTDFQTLKGQYQIAKIAESLLLYEEALLWYQKIIEKEPQEEENLLLTLTHLKTLAAQQLFERAQRFHQEEQFLLAQKWYQKIKDQYPDAPVLIQAENALKEVEPLAQAQLLAQKKKIPPKKVKLSSEELQAQKAQKNLDLANKLLEDGKELTEKALESHGAGNVTRATKNYEKALKSYKESVLYLRKVKKDSKDPEVLKKLYEIHQELRSRSVSIYNSMATLFMADRNYRKADALVQEALRMDPTNAESLQLKAEIDKNRIHRRASDILNVRPLIGND
jgi:tetratricopeptide (TPR) repeat protein